MELNFQQQLELTLIDKAVIGGLLVLAGYVFNRSLEAFKTTQTRSLEEFRATQSVHLETFKLEQNRRIEEFKSQLATETEARRNIRLAVAEVAKRVAAAAHSIAWTTWPARYSPNDFAAKNLNKYDEEIHLLLSDIVGARVVLAALSPTVHGQLSQLIDRLYGLDVDMGEVKSLLAQDRSRGLAALSQIHEASGKLDDQLLDAVTKLKIEPLQHEAGKGQRA